MLFVTSLIITPALLLSSLDIAFGSRGSPRYPLIAKEWYKLITTFITFLRLTNPHYIHSMKREHYIGINRIYLRYYYIMVLNNPIKRMKSNLVDKKESNQPTKPANS